MAEAVYLCVAVALKGICPDNKKTFLSLPAFEIMFVYFTSMSCHIFFLLARCCLRDCCSLSPFPH